MQPPDNQTLQKQVLHQHLPLQQASQQQQQQQQLQGAVGGKSSQPGPTASQLAAPGVAADEETADSQDTNVAGFDPLLVLHDLTSAMPFAPRSFISNDGTTIAPSSQRRRLSVAIPGAAAQVRYT